MGRRLTSATRALRGVALAALAAVLPPTPSAAQEAMLAELRADMVRTIVDHAWHAAEAMDGPELDPRVLRAMNEVPRHAYLPDMEAIRRGTLRGLFLPKNDAVLAYADYPVPIGYGQTMSQPFIVALMTHLLQTRPDHVVLEIGTGSGYQAAVLSPLVKRVCTIEIIPELAKTAAAALRQLGNANVSTRTGDGYHGWPDCGPFDGIVVTAAASHIPPPLVRQLKPGGRMVIPVGGSFSFQYLTVVEKDARGTVTTSQTLPVTFVPFVRAE